MSLLISLHDNNHNWYPWLGKYRKNKCGQYRPTYPIAIAGSNSNRRNTPTTSLVGSSSLVVRGVVVGGWFFSNFPVAAFWWCCILSFSTAVLVIIMTCLSSWHRERQRERERYSLNCNLLPSSKFAINAAFAVVVILSCLIVMWREIERERAWEISAFLSYTWKAIPSAKQGIFCP